MHPLTVMAVARLRHCLSFEFYNENNSMIALPYEIIDHILIYTKNVDLCIDLKRFYPLAKLNYSFDK